MSVLKYGLDLKNPFSGVYINQTDGVKERVPVPLKAIRKVQSESVRVDDDICWITAIVSDTGMRLSEMIGLAKENVVLDHPFPHLIIQPHPWRRLKTEGSKRIVPLVGSALWAAKRAIQTKTGECLFPRNGECLSNSASAAINKWLKHHIPKECSVHSFRHSLRDRLRAIECPSDIIDRIGGWITPGVRQGYGSGYPIAVLHGWMEKVVG